MNFEYLEFLPLVFIAFFAFIATLIFFERKFFSMVKTYWFYDRSVFSYVSSLFLILGIGFLLFSLLDPRGPEEKIKTDVPSDRTIILIDTSASMLAEDAKPSRLQKAVLVAKHFARKAAGHQLSIVVFAEIQKKIVPFTTDIDLIDARLDSIKTLRNQNGSSALSLAIQESVQYFKETGDAAGNILVLTDGEETAEGIKLNVPKEIHVALVGVGTTQGGRIPLDDGRGFRFGYKKNKNRDVITKIDEGFFKKTAADLPSGKYWLANTYSLPSDEILDFFKSEKTKGLEQQDMVIKPVMMEWIVVPGICFLILSYLFKAIRIFSLGLFLIILPFNTRAQEPQQPEIPQEVLNKLERLHNGELNKLERIKLADDLSRAGSKIEALSLYQENLSMDKIDPEVPPEAYLNYGTSLLEHGKPQEGFDVYQNLLSSIDKKSDKGKKLEDMIEKNTMSFFRQEEQKKKQQEEDKKEQEKKDKEKQGQGSGKGESGEGEQNQQKKKPNPEDEKNKDKKGDDKNKEKKDEPKDKDDKKEDNKETQPESEKRPDKLPPQKIPAKLKQLMSDDRQLQMKMIENGTRDLNKRQSRENKDW